MKSYLEEALHAVLQDMGVDVSDVTYVWERPNNPAHGDLSTNISMQLARTLRRAPRQIAEEIVQRLQERPLDPARIAGLEVAGPGFINIEFNAQSVVAHVQDIRSADAAYGTRDTHSGKTAMVEYVSANPTGPLTVGHGRNAVLGDAIASLLASQGYAVTREYYFNDAGRQMRILGESVRARYVARVEPGHPSKVLDDGTTVPASFPEDGYLGDYIDEIAAHIEATEGEAWIDAPVDHFKRVAEQHIFEIIRSTMERLGIHMDTYFNEHTLYTSGAIDRTLDALREAGYAYEAEGAVWFKTTAFGKEKDTVLVKRTGEPTYRLPDIAYHADKIERGFDTIVDIFGADHIATYPDVLSGLSVMGYDRDRIDVVIYQFVTLVRGGEPVKMSTRKATYVTLDELMDEVGEDVTRFFFLMRSPNTHLEFDLDLAREAGEKNPVFYLQYAHARICSILRKTAETGLIPSDSADLSYLTEGVELDLIKVLAQYPDAVTHAATLKEPHRVATYLREVAVAFSQFYAQCRILGEEEALSTARLTLADATRITLRNGLTLLGISVPEHM
jgi:arginyl-tRNA synthetase